MSRELHQHAKQIFLDACRLEGSARREYVEQACDANNELLSMVDAMLRADDDEPDFLSRSAACTPGDLCAGQTLDERYVVRSPLGEGGLGEVWLADQTVPIRRQVAIKVIKLGMDTRRVVARFELERQTLARLDHANIARVYDAGSTQSGRPYFVMELIDGRPLTAFADEHRLDLRERIVLFLSVCDAVQHAHQRGIIHRDIKPSNVLVADVDGHPTCKVIDFGIAKAIETETDVTRLVTLDHQMIGTPAYMSPEQAEGSDDIDLRTDVYSLGVLLYELLTGHTPFDNRLLRESGLVELARIIREEEPKRPSTHASAEHARLVSEGTAPLVRVDQLRGDLDWIALKAIEKDRERRYASPDALADDLRRFLDHRPVSARSPSRVYRLAKFVRRNRTAVASGVLIAGALGAGYLATAHERDRAVEAELVASNAASQALEARDAERSARLAAESALEEADVASQFLSDLLGSADPVGGSQDVKVVDVLQLADEEIGDVFGDRPRVEYRLRRTLGITYRRLGMLDESESNLLRALELARSNEGFDAQDIANILGHLTVLYDNQRRFSDSEPLHREVLELREQLDGPNTRRTLGAHCNFGLFLYDLARFDEAEAQLRATLVRMEQHLDPLDDYLLNCMQGLGTALMGLERSDEAREVFLEVLKRTDQVEGGSPHTRATIFGNLAEVERQSGDFDAALQWIDRSLELFDQLYPSSHWRHGFGLLSRAVILQQLGRSRDAMPDLERSYAIIAENFGPKDPDAQAAAGLMVEACEAVGETELAAEWRARADGD